MRLCIALTALMLAGCGASDHSRFYVLTEHPALVARSVAAAPTTTIALGAVNPDFSYWLGFEGRSRQLHADIVAMKGRNLCESWRA